MPTSRAQTPIDRWDHLPHGCRRMGFARCLADGRRYRGLHGHPSGLTLVELIVAISLLSLFILLAPISLIGPLRRNSFKSQAEELVSAMQTAAHAAAETGLRYEVIIDLTEQSFLLRQITTSDLAEVLEEEIITQSYFGSRCRAIYVEFDDGDYANDGRAKFRVGRAGWQYGGKIVLIDEDEHPYSVVVGRLNPIVQLVEGDAKLMEPKAKEDVAF